MKSDSFDSQSIIDWPTVGLLLINYALWIICLLGFNYAPVFCSVAMCLVLTLQSSLTHELIHGHPSRSNAINLGLGIVPLTLFYPIHLFKETHLKHHQDVDLTYPDVDPESFFYCPIKWNTKSGVSRLYAWTNMTLAGRLLLAVPSAISQVACHAIQDMVRGTWHLRMQWILHFSLLYVLVSVIVNVQSMPIEIYFLCACIGHSVIALRAFFEHKPALNPNHRIVVVNSNFFFRFLFLCNNLHAVHHQYPGLAWYRIAKVYEKTQADVLEKNGRFYFYGYQQWLNYLFRPIHSPVHPGTQARKK